MRKVQDCLGNLKERNGTEVQGIVFESEMHKGRDEGKAACVPRKRGV